eukprot:Hpha_TRINITY_DN16502_c1_g1::TRINITY_DN16502_c1_g1_i1::g.135853::m.135853
MPISEEHLRRRLPLSGEGSLVPGGLPLQGALSDTSGDVGEGALDELLELLRLADGDGTQEPSVPRSVPRVRESSSVPRSRECSLASASPPRSGSKRLATELRLRLGESEAEIRRLRGLLQKSEAENGQLSEALEVAAEKQTAAAATERGLRQELRAVRSTLAATERRHSAELESARRDAADASREAQAARSQLDSELSKCADVSKTTERLRDELEVMRMGEERWKAIAEESRIASEAACKDAEEQAQWLRQEGTRLSAQLEAERAVTRDSARLASEEERSFEERLSELQMEWEEERHRLAAAKVEAERVADEATGEVARLRASAVRERRSGSSLTSLYYRRLCAYAASRVTQRWSSQKLESRSPPPRPPSLPASPPTLCHFNTPARATSAFVSCSSPDVTDEPEGVVLVPDSFDDSDREEDQHFQKKPEQSQADAVTQVQGELDLCQELLRRRQDEVTAGKASIRALTLQLHAAEAALKQVQADEDERVKRSAEREEKLCTRAYQSLAVMRGELFAMRAEVEDSKSSLRLALSVLSRNDGAVPAVPQEFEAEQCGTQLRAALQALERSQTAERTACVEIACAGAEEESRQSLLAALSALTTLRRDAHAADPSHLLRARVVLPQRSSAGKLSRLAHLRHRRLRSRGTRRAGGGRRTLTTQEESSLRGTLSALSRVSALTDGRVAAAAQEHGQDVVTAGASVNTAQEQQTLRGALVALGRLSVARQQPEEEEETRKALLSALRVISGRGPQCGVECAERLGELQKQLDGAGDALATALRALSGPQCGVECAEKLEDLQNQLDGAGDALETALGALSGCGVGCGVECAERISELQRELEEVQEVLQKERAESAAALQCALTGVQAAAAQYRGDDAADWQHRQAAVALSGACATLQRLSTSVAASEATLDEANRVRDAESSASATLRVVLSRLEHSQCLAQREAGTLAAEVEHERLDRRWTEMALSAASGALERAMEVVTDGATGDTPQRHARSGATAAGLLYALRPASPLRLLAAAAGVKNAAETRRFAGKAVKRRAADVLERTSSERLSRSVFSRWASRALLNKCTIAESAAVERAAEAAAAGSELELLRHRTEVQEKALDLVDTEMEARERTADAQLAVLYAHEDRAVSLGAALNAQTVRAAAAEAACQESDARALASERLVEQLQESLDNVQRICVRQGIVAARAVSMLHRQRSVSLMSRSFSRLLQYAQRSIIFSSPPTSASLRHGQFSILSGPQPRESPPRTRAAAIPPGVHPDTPAVPGSSPPSSGSGSYRQVSMRTNEEVAVPPSSAVLGHRQVSMRTFAAATGIPDTPAAPGRRSPPSSGSGSYRQVSMRTNEDVAVPVPQSSSAVLGHRQVSMRTFAATTGIPDTPAATGRQVSMRTFAAGTEMPSDTPAVDTLQPPSEVLGHRQVSTRTFAAATGMPSDTPAVDTLQPPSEVLGRRHVSTRTFAAATGIPPDTPASVSLGHRQVSTRTFAAATGMPSDTPAVDTLQPPSEVLGHRHVSTRTFAAATGIPPDTPASVSLGHRQVSTRTFAAATGMPSDTPAAGTLQPPSE